ncbi:MAG: hypothetical protein JNK20_13370 [Flavipsychrobacter sp.]|jgi:predicted PurR-regulated permease PerM|nr:hypothetical protein [Flavipsychrobacter sp.]
MRLIKLLLISIVFFFLLLTAFTSLIPSTVRISRAVDIQASKEEVLPYLENEQRWPEWNRWFQDSIKKIDVRFNNKTDSSLQYQWATGDRNITSNFMLYGVREGTTTVQWFFEFELSWYPWEKLGSIVYDKQMGPVMDESLGNLKSLVESNP